MEQDNREYTLDIQFEANLPEEAGHPTGIRMYFNNLADAFDRMILINPYAYLSGFSERDRNNFAVLKRPITRAEISSTKEKRKPELKVELLREEGETLSQPGLYYHFPYGIPDFERRLGQSLSDFKGYDSRLPYLLASYLVDERGVTLKDSMAYTRRHDKLLKSPNANLNFAVALTSNFFGKSVANPRNVDPVPFQEFYYYNNANQALKHLLSINFNKLDEAVAWEKDIPFFYKGANVRRGTSEIAQISASTNTDYARYIGGYWLYDQGVHLWVSGSLDNYGIKAKLPGLKNISMNKEIYQVGHYDMERANFERISVVDKMLRTTNKKPEGQRRTRKSLTL